MTIVNWEIKGKIPRIRSLRERLIHEIEGVGRFLFTKIPYEANIGHESNSRGLKWRRNQEPKKSGDAAQA